MHPGILPGLPGRRTAHQLRSVWPCSRTPLWPLCSRRVGAGSPPLFGQRSGSAGASPSSPSTLSQSTEPHTDLIKRGKVQTPIEFGHKVFLAESANGLITQYQVLDGNPSDEDQLQASLENHRRMFGDAPKLYSADRGFYSENNVHTCERNGVETVSIPQRGGSRTPQRQAYEKSP